MHLLVWTLELSFHTMPYYKSYTTGSELDTEWLLSDDQAARRWTLIHRKVGSYQTKSNILTSSVQSPFVWFCHYNSYKMNARSVFRIQTVF